jgi:outer membrane protein TolC
LKQNLIINLIFDDIKIKNTSVQISEKNIAISDYDYNIIKSDFLPTLSFYSNLGYLNSYSDAGVLKSNTQTGYSLGLNLSFNLFNGFRNSIELENKKIIAMNKRLNHNQIIENIHSAFTINMSNYKKYLELIALEEINLTVARQNLDIATERLNQGVSTPLEFREAQQKFFQAKNRLICAKYYAKIFESELMKISGLLILDY